MGGEINMIASDIVIYDLDPYVWRNLGEIVDKFFKKSRTLWILRDNGKIINAIKDGKYVNIPEGTFDLKELFEVHKDLDEILEIEKEALIEWYTSVQITPFAELDSDVYFDKTHRLLKNLKGINFIKNKGSNIGFNKEFSLFDILRKELKTKTYGNCTIVLEVFENENMWFNAVTVFKDYKAKVVTTYDHFGKRLGLDYYRMKMSPEVEAEVRKEYGEELHIISVSKDELFNKINQLNTEMNF